MRILEKKGVWRDEQEFREFSLRFPLPPFMAQRVDVDPLLSFSRAVLGTARNIVFVAQEEMVLLLEAFFVGCSPEGEKRFFFCAAGDVHCVKHLSEVLSQEKSAFLFMARRPEEFWILTLFFVLPRQKRAFVGEPDGALAVCARECFIPFLPADISSHAFWQRSAFLYLPLVLWGFEVEAVDRGFEEGYATLRDSALHCALFLIREEGKGKKRIWFVSESALLRGIIFSFLPLLERSFGRSVNFEILDLLAFSQKWMEGSGRDAAVILVSSKQRQNLRLELPRDFPYGSFLGWEYLNGCSLEEVRQVGLEATRALLRKENRTFVDVSLSDSLPSSWGSFMAFLQCLACYGSWLQEIDVFSDPPLVRFEHQVLSFLKKQRW
ncbi:MAG: hypothetical protein ACUVTO_00580 [Candidatus Caldatribacteriaceae bacterium]